MTIYTKTGDRGTTSLIGGERVGKDDTRVEAYGTVDELSAVIACLRDNMDKDDPLFEGYRADLRRILGNLMSVEALLAKGDSDVAKVNPLPQAEIAFLEKRIDEMTVALESIRFFTIPGGDPLVSFCHLARTVCRRAEREAVRASHDHHICESVFSYLNRLSDYLYQLGRSLVRDLGIKEELWEP